MPVGNIAMGSQVLLAYNHVKPKKILDVGIGFGYWGVTLRNYTGANEVTGTMDNSKYTLDGVERFPLYRNHFWAAYNNIFEGDIADFLDKLPEYDLVLVIDVVEHLEKQVTAQIVKKSKNLLFGVCTDMGEEHQQSPYGNDGENHISLWTPEEFKRLGCSAKELSDNYFVVWKYQ